MLNKSLTEEGFQEVHFQDMSYKKKNKSQQDNSKHNFEINTNE